MLIENIYPHVFNNEYNGNIEPSPDDIVIVFNKNRDILIKKTSDNSYCCPTASMIGYSELQYLFKIDETSYYLFTSDIMPLIEDFEFIPTKYTRIMAPMELSFGVMNARNLANWYTNNKFCGRCGHKLRHSENARSLVCDNCNNKIFPAISPAIIVAVIDGNRILLTKSIGNPYGTRSLIAGFCEVGEKGEVTVAREVMEEVGLKVKNIKYFGSQSWGFNSNLMLAYTAEVDGDPSISLDDTELSDAWWVEREEIEPQYIPSIGCEMIQYFIDNGNFDY